MSHLEIALRDVGLEPLHEILDLELLTHPQRARTTRDLLRRDEHIADDLDHTVPRDTILDGNATEPVDLDADETTVASDVDAETAVLEQSRKIDVEVALGNTFLGLAVSAVVGVRVEGVVRDKVVLEQSLQVLLAVLAEEEGIDARAKLLESEVGGSEESATLVVGGVDQIEETSLAETKLKGGELARKEINDGGNARRWQDERVNAVNDTVGTEDVDGDHAGVEVDSQSSQTDVEGKALGPGFASKVFTLKESRHGVSDKHTLGRVEVLDDVVRQKSLEELLARLVVVLRNLLKSLVRGCKDGVVGLGAVELLDKIGVVVEKLGELGGVLAVRNQLVHGVVRRAVVWRVVRATVMRRTIVRWVVRSVMGRTVVRVVKRLVEGLKLRLEPGLGIESRVLDLVAEAIGPSEGGIKSALGLLGDFVPGVLACLGHFVVVLLEAGEKFILGGNGLFVQGVATAVVLLNGELLEDLLGGQDEGRASCHEWQYIGELHD